MSEENYLSPDLKLWRIGDGTLVLKHNERKTLLAPPRRALPLTELDEFIVFSDLDGEEIGILRRVADLEEGSQRVLREALAREYVLERITRILEVDKEPLSGQTRWRVEIESDSEAETSGENNTDESTNAAQSTLDAEESSDEEKSGALSKVASLLSLSRDRDKGDDAAPTVEREFTISGQEDVQAARYPHIFIVDTERNRYEILDCEALDIDSRRAAERFF